MWQTLQNDLIGFASYLHPGFVVAPHLRLLAGRLQDAEAGRSLRIITNMPPRHGKTLLGSKIFAAWCLGRNPDRPIIVSSYSASMAYAISRAVRSYVRSDRFQSVFPGVELAEDSQAIDAWHLKGHEGGLRAVGVGGSITGHGAGVLIVDDPLRGRAEAESEVMRNKVHDWYGADAYTRLEPNGAVVVTHTRWHEDDLTGRLLAAQDTDPDADTWDVLRLPAIDENGNALWPERYSLKRLQQIRANIGGYDWEALYQGRPTAPEGALIKAAWLQVVDQAPPGLTWVRGWDLAVSTKTSADYTVGARCAIDGEGNLYITDVTRGRWEWPDTRKEMARLAANEQGDTYAVESQGFQLSAIQELQRDPAFYGIAIREVRAERDKVSRALPWISRAESGRVFLVRGPWVQDFVRECISFPFAAHDDQVDAVSIAYEHCGAAPPAIYRLDDIEAMI